MEMKYLAFPFQIKQTSDENPDVFTFEGYASTFNNVDYGNDMVMPGAFKESLAQDIPVRMLWGHDANQLPLGKWVSIAEDAKGLYVKGEIPKTTQMGRDVITLMKMGALNSMSIGFNLNDFDYSGEVRRLKRIKLWEVSMVNMPMNGAATVTAMKAAAPASNLPLADKDSEWDTDAAIARVKEFSGSEDSPNDVYKTAFLHNDCAKANDYAGCKMPFADVVNGKLKAVPKALFKAAEDLEDTDKSADISEEDRTKIKAKVSKYYRRMGMDDPFADKEKSFYLVDDIKNIKTKREIETLLRDSGVFSKQAATMLASRFVAPQGEPVEAEDESKGITLPTELAIWLTTHKGAR